MQVLLETLKLNVQLRLCLIVYGRHTFEQRPRLKHAVDYYENYNFLFVLPMRLGNDMLHNLPN